jgi:hypothetical protein
VIGEIVGLVRPARPDGHGQTWEALLARRKQIARWVKDGLTIVKIDDFLGREGAVVPLRWCRGGTGEATGPAPARTWKS